MNRYEVALKLLEKISPDFGSELAAPRSQADVDAVKKSATADGKQALSQYIRSIEPIPEYTVLFGICADGLPLLLDLQYHQTGPVLISGSSRMNRALLLSMLRSVGLINSPQAVRYYSISPAGWPVQQLNRNANCLGTLHAQDRSAGELIMELSSLVEQRNTGRQRGPAIILAVEDLDAFVRILGEDAYSHFLWLLREGPFAKVWPIVSLHSESRLFLDFKFKSLFDTQVLTSNAGPSSNRRPVGSHDAREEEPVFRVRTGEHQIDFSLPANR